MEKLISALVEQGIDLVLEQGKLKAKAKKGALTAEIAAQITEYKQQLITYLQQTDSLTEYTEQRLPPIEPAASVTGLWPLSYAQQRIWFIDQMNGGSAEYNMPLAIQLDGAIDLVIADRVLTEIVQRHQILRTRYVTVDGVPFQQVQQATPICFQRVTLPLSAGAEAFKAALTKESCRVFDLSADILIRACYFELSGGAQSDYVMLFVLHHIAADGWSLEILRQEFGQLYQGWVTDTPVSLPSISVQYKDYASWQRTHLSGKYLARQRVYWQQQLAGLPLTHRLPLLSARPVQKQTAAGLISHMLDANIAGALLAIASHFRLTPFMFLHAMLALVLTRHSNQYDVIVGTPVANRPHTELSGLIGFFTNTLVLRLDTSPRSLAEYLADVRQCHLAAQHHQDLPFDLVVEQLKVVRSTAYTPLFQIMLTTGEQFYLTHETSAGQSSGDGLKFQMLDTGVAPAKFDLSVDLTLSEQGGCFQWLYDISLFSEAQISSMQTHLVNLLQHLIVTAARDMTALAACPLTQLPILLTTEAQQLLGDGRAMPSEESAALAVHQLFAAQAKIYPGRIAVRQGEQQWSYQQLDEHSNQLAQYLWEQHQLGLGQLVAVVMTPSYDLVLSILAVLKCGAAFLLLESARNLHRLADAEPALVLTAKPDRDWQFSEHYQVVDVATNWTAVEYYSKEALPSASAAISARSEATLAQLACVIYQTDTTELMSGVAISQSNLKDYCKVVTAPYQQRSCTGAWLTEGMQLNPVQILLPLINAGQLTILNPAAALRDLVQQLLSDATDPYLLYLSEASLKVLLRLLPPAQPVIRPLLLVIYSRQMPPALANDIATRFPTSTVYLQYGSAETLAVPTLRALTSPSLLPPLSEGDPDGQHRMLVLGDDLTLLPTGTVGQLYIGGSGLALGYHNDPRATTLRFVSRVFTDSGAELCLRLFNTGDWARYLQDGSIEILGRAIQPLQFLGDWLLPAKIELAVNCHPAVHSSLVMPDHSADGVANLMAFVRLLPDAEVTDIAVELTAFLRPQLPVALLPVRYLLVSELPAEPAAELAITKPQPQHQPQLSTPQQQLLASIWQQLLQVPFVGPDDRFFALGGHSLLAVSLISRLEKSGYKISLKDVYRSASLAEMASALTPVDHLPESDIPVIPADCQQLQPAMLAFVELEQSTLDYLVQQVPGGAGNIQDIYPLLALQTGILYHHLLDAENDPYRQSAELLLHSETAVTELVAAINFVIGRHDLLRCCVISDLAQPVLVVQRHTKLPVFQFELVSTEHISAQLQKLSASRLSRLDQAPLLHLDIGFEPVSQRYHAILTFHHMIIDHIGLEILLQEIAMYRRGQTGQMPVPVSYRLFVADMLSRSQQSNSAAFFAQMLQGYTTPALPFLLEGEQENLGVTEAAFLLPESQAVAIRQLSATQNVSAASFFHLAYALMLQQLTGQADVVFATVLSGRQQGLQGREHSVGMFLNSLPVRITLSDYPIVTLLQQVQQSLIALLEHEQCPLSVAIAASQLKPATPLFNTILNYRHSMLGQPHSSASMHDIELVQTTERTNYPLSLGVTDVSGTSGSMFHLSLKLHASIEQAPVLKVLNHCVDSLLMALTEQPATAVSQLWLPTVSQVSTSDVITDSVHQLAGLFLQTLGRQPAATALCFADLSLSYSDLAVRVTVMATRLQAEGIGRGDKVALCLNRGVEMVVSMLATLLTGACYVPLEPEWPSSRLQFILQDAGVTLVLTEEAVLVANSWLANRRLLLSEPYPAQQSRADMLAAFQPVTIEPADLAYVIYTSGTTGQPKGVLVSHANVVCFASGFASQLEVLGLQPDDFWLWNASYAFDASVKALVSLVSGRPVVLTSHVQSKDPLALVSLLHQYGIQVFNSVPAMVAQIADILTEQGNGFVHLISSGEDVSPRIWQRLLTYCQQTGKLALNAYGPTETTVNACFGLIAGKDGVHMGRPLRDSRCYILNENQQQVSAGIVGELYIGGPAVAMGYLNRPEQTAASFVSIAGIGADDSVLYKTGDLVRLSEQGNLVFCGRVDHQVKIRGYRLELEEIERALLAINPMIRQVAVLVQEAANGTKQLAAFVQSDELLEPALLKQQLSAVLPDYMVPELFSVLSSFPLLSSGKIDRAALSQTKMPESGNKTQPRNETEAILCDIWQKLLQLDTVGVYDDFFMLGGDSILSMQVVAQARRKQLNISIRQLLSARTVAALAEQLSVPAGRGSSQQLIRGEQLLLPVQQQFFADLVDGGQHFNQSLFVQLPAGLTAAAIERFVAALIDRHDVFRLAFSQVEPGVWQARYLRAALSASRCIEVVCMEQLNSSEQAQAIHHFADKAHTSFTLAEGGLLRVVFFDYGPAQSGRLLLIAHHLVVDGVSWRVIAADLAFWLQQLEAGQTASLPPKSASYQQWACFLQDYARSQAFTGEMFYWQQLSSQISQQGARLPLQGATRSALVDWQHCQFALSAADTSYLLNVMPQIWACDINEILLSALLLAWQQWIHQPSLVLLMEGHGREALPDAPDVSETVGWFTSKYPLLLSCADRDPATVVAAIKQQYRAMPSKGIGYGLARYLAAEPLTDELGIEAMLLFNYLGNFDSSFSAETALQLVTEHSGEPVAASYQPKHALTLTGMVWQRKLMLKFSFCSNRILTEQAGQLMACYRQALQQMLTLGRQSWSEQQAMSHLGMALDMTELSQIVLPLSQSHATVKLFCAPPVSGTSLVYQPLARLLMDVVACYGLQLPDLYTDIRTESVCGLAAFYCSLIKRCQPTGPYLLLGWSSGGTVAYEIARQLTLQGERVHFLALLDQPLRQRGQQTDLWQYNPYFKIAGLYGSKLVVDWEQVRHQPAEEALPWLVQQACLQGLKPADADERMMLRHFEALVSFPQVMDAYQAAVSTVGLTIFQAAESDHQDPTLGWQQVCSAPIKTITVAGAHQNMVYEPHVVALAALIKQELESGDWQC